MNTAQNRITGKCPNCGAPVVDGNTYDSVRCMREFEAHAGPDESEEPADIPFNEDSVPHLGDRENLATEI